MRLGVTITPAGYGSQSEELFVIWSKYMSFFTKATIRAFAARKHRLTCSRRLWRHLVAELERRSEGEHESGAFLLGVMRKDKREVQDFIFYDDVDPGAYSTGVCILHGDGFAKLWAECRRRKMTVVADAHTHPEAAFQSWSDKANPMVARAGHIAIIIPNYARMPVLMNGIRIYEYCGQHEWIDRSPSKEPDYLYTGFWS
jgi:hypothetical protein